MSRPNLNELKLGVPKTPLWKDPAFWVTAVLITLVVLSGIILTVRVLQLAEYSKSELFLDVDEARKYQQECLNKYGGSATVSENSTGIMITCRWRKQ